MTRTTRKSEKTVLRRTEILSAEITEFARLQVEYIMNENSPIRAGITAYLASSHDKRLHPAFVNPDVKLLGQIACSDWGKPCECMRWSFLLLVQGEEDRAESAEAFRIRVDKTVEGVGQQITKQIELFLQGKSYLPEDKAIVFTI